MVNFYAAARAATGLSQSEFEGTTLAEVLAAISGSFPGLIPILPGCSYLVNGSATVDQDLCLIASDVVDILPRFAGGAQPPIADIGRAG
jgi:molybdopterin converting factor small subunit